MPLNKGYTRDSKNGTERPAQKGATPRDPHGNMTPGTGRKDVYSTVEKAGFGNPRKK